jgi:CRP-like cAMP-binding protein
LIQTAYFKVKLGTGPHERIESRVNTFNVGDYFGERSFMTKEPRSKTISAIVLTDIYTISTRNFLMLIKQQPSMKKALSKVFTERSSILTDIAQVGKYEAPPLIEA